VEHESVDRNDPAGLERWRASGSPPVPAIEIDGEARSILHVGQLATLLDLPAPPSFEATRLCYDLLLLVESWAANVRDLPWELVVAPTSSRDRSIRNLTMNAVYPISLLREAWETGRLDWGLRDIDEELAAGYETSAELGAFADGVTTGWRRFVLACGDELAERDPVVETPRGRLPYSELLAHQRWHLAFHHRQVVEFLASRGIQPPHPFRVEQFADLSLPASVF
jgi:hypothetical protein